jgi:glutathione synthase/RimK-type ligase-like ATP-grasp enzyme
VAELIVRSMGAPARDGSGSKQRVNEIAAALGIRVPRQAVVDTPGGACAFSRTVGYPIMLKKENTFGGMGVTRCGDDRETLIAWYRLRAQARWQRGVARFGGGPAQAIAPLRRWLMDRPAAPLIAQQFIPGRLGFRSFVADRGRVLAGITAIAEEHNPAPFGASSVVRFIDHPEVERATAALARALDLSGFGGVDFLFEAGTEQPYLLELNARVTPIAHLGKRLGVDLCAALHAATAGQPATAPTAPRETVVALFPSELERDPNSRWLTTAHHDVPWDERALLEAWEAQLAEPVRAFLARQQPAA